ncbi:MAG: alpha/beta hydrolase [Rhodopirellula sp.]|nr:alpha/beta hydrolase [Rhodopirellula sp.]
MFVLSVKGSWMRVFAATNDGAAYRLGRRCWAIVLFVSVMILSPIAFAPIACAQDDKDEEPKLRTVELKTKDGMRLRAFYLPSNKGKAAKTVLLVHEWKGQASPYGKLVSALRDAGCAVLVPDYRGHGGSREQLTSKGTKAEMDTSKMSKRDIENIVKYDLEKAKSFLKGENDSESLNLNAMVVIGVGEGCVMAAHWAARDWKWPTVGRIKQGRDVKGLVFISPTKQAKGVPIDPIFSGRSVLVQLPIMVVSGTESPNAEDAERIANRIEASKKKLQRGGDAKGFEYKRYNTALMNASLVKDIPAVIPAITKFIETEVKVSDTRNPWVSRQ